MISAAGFTVILAIVFQLLINHTKFGVKPEKNHIANYYLKQLIIGIAFGISGIYACHFGYSASGVIVNARDSAPIVGGFLFGGPAGIIAGLICGIYRYFFGVGEYSKLACGLAAIFAGIFTAILRHHMFDDKRPYWVYGIGVGICTEVFHMLIILLSHMNDISTAFDLVKVAAPIMIVINSITISVAILAITLINGEKAIKKEKNKGISTTFQFWLAICIVLSMIVTTMYTFLFQTELSREQARYLITINIEEIERLINSPDYNNEYIITATDNIHVGSSGKIMVIDKEKNLVNTRYREQNFFDVQSKVNYENFPEPDTLFRRKILDVDCYGMYRQCGDYYIFAYIPTAEVMFYRSVSTLISAFMSVLTFAALFMMVFMLIKKTIIDSMIKVNKSLNAITNGDLNEKVDVRINTEFEMLSDGINHTVDALKRYIKEAEDRMDAELKLAHDIQVSTLPTTFPTTPKFEIFAKMDTAKDVGGDFYDFFTFGDDNLFFIIADVSGKGIPAAMCMMRARTLIKGLCSTMSDPGAVLTVANNRLCEKNDAGMFLTAWFGVLNTKTGVLSYANAGHNPPFIAHGGDFEMFKTRPGLVLAGLENTVYKTGTLQLNPNDIIYLYTDGITEAINTKEELYQEDRLCKILNKCKNMSMKEICMNVKKDVDEFAGEAQQFDDMTMIGVKWNGDTACKELRIEATVENIDTVTDFVDSELTKYDCPPKPLAQINIAIDELFGNIAHYAYNPNTGPATVRVNVVEDPLSVVITFIDNGIQYDPLAMEDPDTALSAEERQIGGLGIYMVKKTMDDISYEYKNGQNILKIKKLF